MKEKDFGIPILGKSVHEDECQFMKIGDFRAWYTKDISLMSDGVGFWIM